MEPANFAELRNKIDNWDISAEELLLQKMKVFTINYNEEFQQFCRNMDNFSNSIEMVEVEHLKAINQIKTLSRDKFIENALDKGEESESESVSNENSITETPKDIQITDIEKMKTAMDISMNFVNEIIKKNKNKEEIEDDNVSVASSKIMIDKNAKMRLPHIIGTEEFKADKAIGLNVAIEEDENKEKKDEEEENEDDSEIEEYLADINVGEKQKKKWEKDKKKKEKKRKKQKEIEIEKEKEKMRERERRQKFRSIEAESIKGRSIFSSYSLGDGPGYPDFKDEFEKIVEKNKRKINVIREFKPRFQDYTKEKIQKPYNDQEIWKRWESNRENLREKGHLKIFLDYCRQKEMEHNENMKKLEEQNDEIRKIRREILIKKGYSDPAEIKSINYSLVEESSPKYSMKGRSMPKTKVDNEEIGNLLLGQNLEMIEYIRNAQINRPLPNINFVKPNNPSFIFSRAERFLYNNKPYEGSMDLFKDGIFAPKTQEDFRCKGTFPLDEKRGLVFNSGKSPSPCDYKIKSSFDIIADEGKIISDTRKKIKINEEIEKEKRRKMLESQKMRKEEKNENEDNNNTEDKNVFKFTHESEDKNNDENNI